MRRWFGVLVLLVACAAERGTIGAVLGQTTDGKLMVRDVPEGLGADKAGLQAGDEILTIDGMDVRMLSTKQVHNALSGDVGETVRLTVVRGEEVLRITVKRTLARKRKRTEPQAP